MAASSQQILARNNGPDLSRKHLFLVSLIAMSAAIFVTGLAFINSSEFVLSLPYPYLLPWALLLALLIGAVTVVSLRKGLSAFSTPLMFASAFYFFPAFVIGTVCFAVGWSDPAFASRIVNPETDLPFTMEVIILGYLGLAVGYMLPVGRLAANAIFRRFSFRERAPGDLVFPTMILLVIGLAFSIYAVYSGIAGYQLAEEPGIFDGLIHLGAQFSVEGRFMLWWIFFRRRQLDSVAILSLILLIASVVLVTIASGSRGSLPASFQVTIFAFILAGGRITSKKMIVTGAIVFVLVIAGMIWGTTFRQVKGSENRVTIGQYADAVGNTFEEISNTKDGNPFAQGLRYLALRLDTVSSVAVVVSNYEQLEPYEESYGLQNNIIRDLTVPFIPRILWPDRPEMSNARQYAELYFDFGENSFAVTPMADLLRNFGIYGVVLGMMILGLILRFIYAGLVEGQKVSLYRSALYYALLTAVTYEGFYGTIFPQLVKFAITTVLGILFVEIVAGRRKNGRTARILTS